MKVVKGIGITVAWWMAHVAFATPRLESVTYAGDGCPPGSAQALISPDGEAVTVVFDQFVAIQDRGAPGHDRADRCTLFLSLAGVPGQQWTITSVDYRGFALLDDKTWGMQHSRYKFKGGQFMKPSHARLDGPYASDYFRRDESGDFARGWSRCGEPVVLEIETRMQVGGRGRGLMSVDSIDGESRSTRQDYRLAGRDCS